jgi:20S proteasome subunit alpha 1
MKASTSSGNTAVAVRGASSAAFITQRKVPVRSQCAIVLCKIYLCGQDRLIDPTSMTSIYRITDSIGCLMLGLLRTLNYY